MSEASSIVHSWNSVQAGIAVTTVTETLVPAGASFQDWQADQLQKLADALAQSTGKTASSVSAQAAPATDSAGTAPTGAQVRTGASDHWLVPLGGAVLVLGGVGLAGGAARRRNRRLLRGA